MDEAAKKAALIQALKKPQGTLGKINAQHVTPPKPQSPAPRPSFIRG